MANTNQNIDFYDKKKAALACYYCENMSKEYLSTKDDVTLKLFFYFIFRKNKKIA